MKLQSITAWRYLTAFGSFGRISDVASHFDVNASSVSRALRELEASLGYPLFRAEGRNLRLTERGKAAVKLMKPAIDMFDRQIAQISKLNAGVSGPIRLSVAGGFAASFLLDYLDRFKALYPDIVFEVSSGRKIPALRSGTCDIVTVTGRPENEHVVFLPRGVNHYVPVASPAFLDRNKQLSSPDDLRRVRVFAYGGAERTPTRVLVRGREKCELELKEYLRIDSVSAIKQAVLQGKGMAIDLPVLHCAAELAAGNLVPVLSGWHRPDEELYVVTSRIGWQAPRIRIFAQWFAEESRKEYERCWKEIEPVLKRCRLKSGSQGLTDSP
ncbi:LysR family transcriptional regulator [Mesosutterella sp. AGMB02718]|uniref:LysR family transcriptional regulator n=1 Tax=Mesosutterella faecium TaxID=2925194 RepID=A0ABT7INQ2_9BURK|nr:LysR family transcriptional regulator [Mesosutterella sp. AGMB02718]MDL2060010.1 LysR family transcriptional regulator [Mesosutterella sp. AGMB02718]